MAFDDSNCPELTNQIYFLWRLIATLSVGILTFIVLKLWRKVSRLECDAAAVAAAADTPPGELNDNVELLSATAGVHFGDEENFLKFNGSLPINEQAEGLRRRKGERRNVEELPGSLERRHSSYHKLTAPPSDNHCTTSGGACKNTITSADFNNTQCCCCCHNTNNPNQSNIFEHFSGRSAGKITINPPPRSTNSNNNRMKDNNQFLVTTLAKEGDGHVTEIEMGDWATLLEEGKPVRKVVNIVTTLDIVIKPPPAGAYSFSSGGRIRRTGYDTIDGCRKGHEDGRKGRPIRINLHINSFAVLEEDTHGMDQIDVPELTLESSGTEEEPVNSLLEVANAHTIEEVVRKVATLDSVGDIIREAGLESSNLIFGIDYTASNKFQGKKSFSGKSLHCIEAGVLNPYQQVISVLGKTLAPFATSGFIAGYGFGDAKTEDKGVFPLCTEHGFCTSFEQVLDVYNKVTPNVVLSGPTNFAPLIYEAINICKQVKTYHILVIVADGQVTNEQETKDAIVTACNYPLSIIVVGVGDGPWDMMTKFDGTLPRRTWDNFHFVDFHKVTAGVVSPDLSFSVQALIEIPDQYKKIKQMGLV